MAETHQQYDEHEGTPAGGEEPNKRARTESEGGGGASSSNPGSTSRVLFLRSLSYETRPDDIVPHFVQFGAIKMLHLAHKGQAFVEFPTIAQAQQAVDHAVATNLQISGRAVRCSKSFTPDGLDHERGAVLLIGPGGVLTNLDEVVAQLAGTPSLVVVLNIFNSNQTPVTLDAVHSLASYLGPVSRILLFDKDGRTNAMVEFGNLETAIKAQKMLHRHHLWNNQTGLILTTFSKQSSLNIAGYLAANPSNYGRARDFTPQASAVQINPNFPTATVTGNTPYAQQMQQQQQQQQQQQPPPPPPPQQSGGGSYGSLQGDQAYPSAQPAPVSGGYSVQSASASSSGYAAQPVSSVGSASTSYGGQYGAQYGTTSYGGAQSAPSAGAYGGQYSGQSSSQYGTSYQGQQGSRLPSQQPPPPPSYGGQSTNYGQAYYAPTSSSQQQQQYGMQQQPYGQQSYNPHQGGGMGGAPASGLSQRVLMVAGVDKSHDNMQHLFNLMGFWGNVVRIKFMFKQDNIAMVEFATPEEAQSCLKLFKGVELFGKPVNARQAKAQFETIKIHENDEFSRDFSSEKRGRYMKGVHSPNYRQVCVPSSKLHLAYLHNYSEEEIRQLFGQYGRVVAFHFSQDPTMGFVQMETVNEACTALACLHGLPNPRGGSGVHPLRVSFTSRP